MINRPYYPTMINRCLLRRRRAKRCHDARDRIFLSAVPIRQSRHSHFLRRDEYSHIVLQGKSINTVYLRRIYTSTSARDLTRYGRRIAIALKVIIAPRYYFTFSLNTSLGCELRALNYGELPRLSNTCRGYLVSIVPVGYSGQ